MSEFKHTVRGEAVSPENLERPKPGLQSDDANASAVDRHASWLKEWRSLRADIGGQGSAHDLNIVIRELQDKIAHTPAVTLVGLQAQAELIAELAWNDVVAATARQLLWGIKRLQREGDGCR